jgi:hypothetical protein
LEGERVAGCIEPATNKIKNDPSAFVNADSKMSFRPSARCKKVTLARRLDSHYRPVAGYAARRAVKSMKPGAAAMQAHAAIVI